MEVARSFKLPHYTSLSYTLSEASKKIWLIIHNLWPSMQYNKHSLYLKCYMSNSIWRFMIVFTLIQVKFINKIGNLQRYNYATCDTTDNTYTQGWNRLHIYITNSSYHSRSNLMHWPQLVTRLPKLLLAGGHCLSRLRTCLLEVVIRVAWGPVCWRSRVVRVVWRPACWSSIRKGNVNTKFSLVKSGVLL